MSLKRILVLFTFISLFVFFLGFISADVSFNNPVVLNKSIDLNINYNSYSPFVYFYDYSGSLLGAVNLGCAGSSSSCRGFGSYSVHLNSQEFPLGVYSFEFYSYDTNSWITKSFEVDQYSSSTKTCSDGTSAGQCSSNKPLNCLASSLSGDALGLVNDCSLCGCPSGDVCQSGGSCIPSSSTNSGSTESGGSSGSTESSGTSSTGSSTTGTSDSSTGSGISTGSTSTGSGSAGSSSNSLGCTDTDGGINYFVKGTVTVPSGSYTDLCSGNTLSEGYCYNSNTIGIKNYLCPNGCSNGACIGSSGGSGASSNNSNEGGESTSPSSGGNSGSVFGNESGGYIIELENKPLIVQAREFRSLADGNNESSWSQFWSSILPANWGITPVTDSNLNAKIESVRNQLNSERNSVEQNIARKLGKSNVVSITGNVVKSSSNDLTVMASYNLVYNGIVLNISANESEKIKNVPGVKAVYPNKKVQVLQLLDPSIPQTRVNATWKLDANGNNCAISGKPCITGQNVTIGIIDTGVDYSHPDLGNCTQTQFLSGNCKKVVGGYNFVSNNNDPMDDMGHGTQVASIAAGNGTLMGVAPGAKIYAYKVLNQYGSGYTSWILSGINRAMDPDNDGNTSDHVDIISLSLGGTGNPDDPMSQAINNAVNAGVVAIVAAGNSGTAQSVNSPGTASKAITVGAVDKYNNLAWFSSQGPVIWTNSSGQTNYMIKPDISAPGVMICGAKWDGSKNVLGQDGYPDCIDSHHIYASGTSQATPYIAGVAALLLQKHPNWTPEEIRMDLKGTATENKICSSSTTGISSCSIDYSQLNQKGFGVVNTSSAVSSYNTTETPCIAHLQNGRDIKGVANIYGEAYCNNPNNFANYTLYYVNSTTGNLNTIYYSSNQVNLTNGVLEKDFPTFSLPEGEDTLMLIVRDKFGHESKDATIFKVSNVVLNRIGNTLNYLHGVEEINGSFSFTPTNISVEYRNVSSIYNKVNSWSKIAFIPKVNSGSLGNIDVSSLSDGKYDFRICGGINNTWVCSTSLQVAVVKEMLPGWPIELPGFPFGVPNVVNDTGSIQLVVPSWRSNACTASLSVLSNVNNSYSQGGNMIYSSNAIPQSIKTNNASNALISPSNALISTKTNVNSLMVCSGGLIVRTYNNTGNLVHTINQLRNSSNVLPMVSDSFPLVYENKYLALVSESGFFGNKGIVNLSGDYVFNWPTPNQSNLDYPTPTPNGPRLNYIGGPFTGFSSGGHGYLFNVRVDPYVGTSDYGSMYIEGYDAKGYVLPHFPIKVKTIGSGTAFGIGNPIIIKKGSSYEIGIVSENYNISSNNLPENSTLYLDLYSFNGSLITQKILYRSRHGGVSLMNPIAGDFEGNGDQEIVIGYGVVNETLFNLNHYNKNAYNTFFKIIDGYGNVVSSVGPIQGHSSIVSSVTANINGNLSVVAALSPTFAENFNKIISFGINGKVNSFEVPFEDNLNILDGVVVGNLDNNSNQEIIVGYRDRYYQGNPSGFYIYYENGTLKRNLQIPTLGRADDYVGVPPILVNNSGNLEIIQQSNYADKNLNPSTRIYAFSLGGSVASQNDWPMFQHDPLHSGVSNLSSSLCIPNTCSTLGIQCGVISNGCGGTLNCGTCSSGNICSSSGQCLQQCSQSDTSCGLAGSCSDCSSIGGVCFSKQCVNSQKLSGNGCGSEFSNCPSGGYTYRMNKYCNLSSGYQGRFNGGESNGKWTTWSNDAHAVLCEHDFLCGISGDSVCTNNEDWQIRRIGTCTASGTKVTDAGLCCNGKTKWVTKQEPNKCTWCTDGGSWPWCWPWNWKRGVSAAQCGTHSVNDYQVCA